MRRFPRGPLKAAIYSRLHTAAPLLPIYAVAPELNTELPYGILGRFRSQYGPLDSFKGSDGWSGTFLLSVFCISSVSSDLDTWIDSIVQALTSSDLRLDDDWDVIEFVVESVEIAEVAREDIGPLLCGVLSLRFSVLDRR